MLFNPLDIFKALVSAFMRYNQFTALIIQCFDQFNGKLYPFSPYNACRLQNHYVICFQTKFFTKLFGTFSIQRWIFKIQDIGNNRCRNPPAMGQFFLCGGINNHMFNVGKVRRESHVKIFANGINGITGPFPVKIMMMGNGGNLCFRNVFC